MVKFDSNPLFPQTTIFIGNGFDLSLGLHTKYTDFFNHIDDNGNKDFWPVHDSFTEEEHLYSNKILYVHYGMMRKASNASLC